VISRVEARLQGRIGPRVLQPYYDIAKLFRKEALAPTGSSWVFLAAPVAAMTCYLTVPLLIPVLTTAAKGATRAIGDHSQRRVRSGCAGRP
jgi:formate hydrogenlyase subunit 4